MKLSGLVPMQALGMASRKPANTIKESEMDVVPTEKDSNVANGLPQTQGDEKKLTLSREHFKNIVREVMKEEEEYQKVHNKMLDKFGITSKKDIKDENTLRKFEDAVKGVHGKLKERMKIKEAELSAGQKKLDVDGDGEIEGSDLAKLRSKNESKKRK